MNNLFSKLQGSVARGLNTIRGDLPATSAAPISSGAAPAIAPVAAFVGGWEKTNIDVTDFRSGVWRSDDWATLAYMKIEPGTAYRLSMGKGMKFYLRALAKETFAAGATANRTLALPGLVKTQQADRVAAGTFHPEVVVWTRTGTIWTQAVIVSVTFDPSGVGGSVTYTAPGGSVAGEVYYTHAIGEFRLRAVRELGTVDDSSAFLWNDSASGVHTVDQNNIDTKPRWPRDTELVEGQRLALEVKSTLEHSFNPRARNLIVIQAEQRQISISDKVRLNQAAEIAARQGV